MLNWLLPENIADVLPLEARKIESLRRAMLDKFHRYGYELVLPPMLEYIESLLAGAGKDTDLRTFKLVDQMSGRTMGVRADMTTQVARIDAHLLNRPGVTRLCYVGSVLHVRPHGLHATREPLQIGAEIYGHAGLEADAEIQELALASLALAGFNHARLDLSHAGLVRAILDQDVHAKGNEAEIYGMLQAKDLPALDQISTEFDAVTRAALLVLPTLYGDADVIRHARSVLPGLPAVTRALDELQLLVDMARTSSVTIDLADLRGYQYESGAMFAMYVEGLPNAVVRGGRYDHVGEAFGRARPGTGFSMDLRELVRLIPLSPHRRSICAPWSTDPQLREIIAQLRHAGEVVIQIFPGHENDQDEFDCDRAIVQEQGQWILKKTG